MSPSTAVLTLTELLKTIDLPDSAYETAERRYKDLAEWFGRPESACRMFAPHIYPQGSFRLGTAVRPITTAGVYDLDVGCRLDRGVTTESHTQAQLKVLVGDEMTAYRTARGISAGLEEKRRCWRLKYADDLSFHIDTVPSIPAGATRQVILEKMVRAGVAQDLAREVVASAGAITDITHPAYRVLRADWRISNSKGYALWFESRMKMADRLLLERALKKGRVRVDDLPAYQWKSPLQATVQILKRHRDVMFAASCDRAPVSVIITTLAAQAYGGEQDVEATLARVLGTMGNFVGARSPRIPNPVNPAEDFADKWTEATGRELDLEGNFWRWLEQARKDFAYIRQERDGRRMMEMIKSSFAASVDPAGAGLTSSLLSSAVPGALSFPPKPIVPNKPAGFA